MMRVKLPSGRVLHYLYPRIEEVTREFKKTLADGTVIVEKKKVPALSYEGVNQLTKKWGRTFTHGGKLTENLVQAIARDVLAAGMIRATKMGFKIVLHVHDEIVAEVPDNSRLTIEDLCEAMASPMTWAPDLPLAAEGAVSVIYKK
jgi:DNA polymerase